MGVPEFLPVDVYLGCFQTGLCLVTQSCLTLCDPMHCSPAGFSSPWGFSRQEYWSELLRPLPRDLPNPGIEPKFPALRVDSLSSEPPEKPKNTGVGTLSLPQGIFLTRNQTRTSCIADGFFINWATKEALGISEIMEYTSTIHNVRILVF